MNMKTLFAFDLHTLRQDPFAMERFNTEVFQCLKKYGTEQNIWQGIEPMVLLTKHQISGNSNFIVQLPHTVEKELLSFATRWDDHAVAAWCDLMQGKGKISEIYFDILQYLVNQYKIEYFVYWGSNHTIKKFCDSIGIYSAAMELGPTRPPFRETRYCDFAGVNGDSHIRHVDIEQFEPINLASWRMSGGISFKDGSMEDSVFRPLTTKYAERIYKKKYKTALVVLQLDDDSNCLIHSRYSGMLEMLQEVIPQCLAAGWQVLIKPHPGAAPERNQGKARWRNVQAHLDCRAYLEDCDQERVVWLDDVPVNEYTSLLSKMDAVISVNSSVGFEAMLLEKIVVALGNAPYNIQNKLPELQEVLNENVNGEKYADLCARTGNLLLNHYLASENILSNPFEISAFLRRNLFLTNAMRQGGYTLLTDTIKSNPINLRSSHP